MTDDNTQPRSKPLDDPFKALLVGIGNFFLLIVIAIAFGLQSGARWGDLYIFAAGEVLVIGYCLALVSLPHLPDAIARLSEAVASGITIKPHRRPPNHRVHPLRIELSLLAAGLWPMIILNFVVVGFLVVRTGGPINSAFGQVPLVMLAIGLLLVEVPKLEIELRWRAIGTLFRAVARAYLRSIIMAVAFYTAVFSLGSFYPDGLGPVPIREFCLVTGLSFTVSIFTAYVSRAGTAPERQRESQAASR